MGVVNLNLIGSWANRVWAGVRISAECGKVRWWNTTRNVSLCWLGPNYQPSYMRALTLARGRRWRRHLLLLLLRRGHAAMGEALGRRATNGKHDPGQRLALQRVGRATGGPPVGTYRRQSVASRTIPR